MLGEVRVIWTKYDGGLHWHQTMNYLGQDEHGTWLAAPAGSEFRRGTDPPLVNETHTVTLIPPDAWWQATFFASPREVEIYCDIATPARWLGPGEVTMVDLDLDVCRMRSGREVRLLDEDEFAEHQIRYGYPDDMIRHAAEAADWLRRTITANAEPFGIHYRRWLDTV